MTREEHFEQGMNHFVEDRLEDAIAEFEKAVALDENFGDALHALAMSHYHLSHVDEAIRWGEAMRKAEPDNVHAYTSLSMFYNAKGFIAKAEEMGARAAKLAE